MASICALGFQVEFGALGALVRGRCTFQRGALMQRAALAYVTAWSSTLETCFLDKDGFETLQAHRCEAEAFHLVADRYRYRRLLFEVQASFA
jgi:hypothetical protein